MNRKVMILSMILIFVVIISGVISADDQDESVFALYGNPEIDGEVDEIWEETSSLMIEQMIHGDAEYSANGEGRVLWDEDYLYVLFLVETDYELTTEPGKAWQKDSVEVFIDEENTKLETYDRDVQIRVNVDNEFSYGSDNTYRGEIKENIIHDVVKDGTDYVIEIAYPWQFIEPEAGDIIGFDLQINESYTGSQRDAAITWYNESGQGFRNPSVFGEIALKK